LNRTRFATLALLLALGLTALPASADYAEALAAMQQLDFTKAFPLMQKSAEAGDTDAMYGLGLLYWNGEGVKPNLEQAIKWMTKAATAGNAEAMNALAKMYMTGVGQPRDVLQARSWAEKSAKTGNADGEVNYYLTVVSGPELNYREGGSPDIAKYNTLARRSLSERTLDQQAYDMLGKALDQGSPEARLYTVAEMVDKVGPGNRSRVLELMQELPGLPKPLEIVQASLQSLSKIGDSYTNFVIFVNAKRVAEATAAVMARRAGYFGDTCAKDDLKISATSISRPLANAVYLPAAQHQLATVFLIAGNWQEKWVFDACGKTVAVPMEFQADGMGGATFQAMDPGAASAK